MDGAHNVLLGPGRERRLVAIRARGALGEERLYCVHVALWVFLLSLA